jgi:hypothetical protein
MVTRPSIRKTNNSFLLLWFKLHLLEYNNSTLNRLVNQETIFRRRGFNHNGKFLSESSRKPIEEYPNKIG